MRQWPQAGSPVRDLAYASTLPFASTEGLRRGGQSRSRMISSAARLTAEGDSDGLEGEPRILAPPEPEVGPDAASDDEHEIGHQRTVPDRPFGEVEAVHQTAPRRRTFWPGRNVCTPAVTTNSPVSSPWEITTSAGSYRSDLDAAQGHRLALRIDHPHGRASPCLGEGARRHLDAGRRGQSDAADDSVSQLHRRRRIGDPDLHLKCPRRGIRLGRNLPHPAGRLHLWVVGEGDVDQRVAAG